MNTQSKLNQFIVKLIDVFPLFILLYAISQFHQKVEQVLLGDFHFSQAQSNNELEQLINLILELLKLLFDINLI
ncbi:hypothetical protein [Paraferrimonas sp. SM1919]|uniref:hypothetical protein n=1 Tax=Paraferrimonas sp. SM1919 TaxID=2662263 RepID=UPI0013D6CFB6|nr:hypothetical protein [Paraferrimonas sp. SM1919]